MTSPITVLLIGTPSVLARVLYKHRQFSDLCAFVSETDIYLTFILCGRSSATAPVSSPQTPTYPLSDTSQTASVASFYPHSFHTVTSRQNTRPHHRSLESQTVSNQPGGPFVTSPLSPDHSPSPVQSTYPETPTSRLLAYLLSPEGSPLAPEWHKGYRALPDYQRRLPLRLDDWGEVGIKLQDPAFRIE